MIAMHHAIFGRNTIIVNNLLTMSEGNVTTYSNRTQVVDAPISIVGFDNSVAFDNNSVARYVYKNNYTPTIGVTYNLSFFIEMEDGGVPVIGRTSTQGDFSLVMNNAIVTSGYAVTHISGNIYRVSGFRAATSVSKNMGVVKYTGQSARKFKISGIQLTEGADLLPYKKTT